jgi:hypothetical protein
MSFRRVYELLFRPWPPIRDSGELADFIDAQSAFLIQKGIFEYSRARAGHYAKVLFREQEFKDATEQSRWQAFPLGLAMVAEVVEGVLHRRAGDDRGELLEALQRLVLSVFDRYPVPDALGSVAWSEGRTELAQRLQLIGLHAPKRVIDIPEPFFKRYFNLMPIHKDIRSRDLGTTHNYLKVMLCNIHEELTRRMDAPAVLGSLRGVDA